MNLRKIIREEIDDFSWVGGDDDILNLFLNKAFYFTPKAEAGDEDYEYLTSELVRLGFKPQYGTPLTVGNYSVVGLYAYLDKNGDDYYFVFTSSGVYGDGEIYKDHIMGFARSESIDKGDYLTITDARDFVKSIKEF